METDSVTTRDTDDFDEVLAAFRDGIASFGQLLHRIRPYLLKVASDWVDPNDRRLLGGASNLVDDVIAKAFLQSATFRGDSQGELKSWLKTILRSTMQAELTKLHQAERVATELAERRRALPTPSEEVSLRERTGSLEVTTSRQEEIELAMFRALRGLPLDEIIVFLLQKPPSRKATFERIAELLDVSERTARERFKHVLEVLQNNAELKALANRPDRE